MSQMSEYIFPKISPDHQIQKSELINLISPPCKMTKEVSSGKNLKSYKNQKNLKPSRPQISQKYRLAKKEKKPKEKSKKEFDSIQEVNKNEESIIIEEFEVEGDVFQFVHDSEDVVQENGRMTMRRIGLDLGTKHIVVSEKINGEVKSKYEMNGYLILPRSDNFTEQLLIRQKVPYVRRDNQLIAIGAKAEKLAYSFNKNLCRPMAEGSISKSDDDAQTIIATIIKSIIGKVSGDALLYYCTTAKSINSENLNVDFHKKVVKHIIESYAGANIKARHVNEARCLIFDELGEAVGISWGAGTVTVHAGVFGVPIFEFSVTGSGDFIDIEAAKQFGYDPQNPHKDSKETPTTICRRKESIDLKKMPSDNVGRVIYMMYDILIENVVRNIFKGFDEYKSKFRFDKPVNVINAGGTSMPNGFIDLLKREFDKYKSKSPIPIGEVKHAEDPLFAVSKGCLFAAEADKDDENVEKGKE